MRHQLALTVLRLQMTSFSILRESHFEHQGSHMILEGERQGLLTFVGQSPIQRRFQSSQFTVTIDRHPFTIELSDMPRLATGWARLLISALI